MLFKTTLPFSETELLKQPGSRFGAKIFLF
jgi:hypothetical protein